MTMILSSRKMLEINRGMWRGFGEGITNNDMIPFGIEARNLTSNSPSLSSDSMIMIFICTKFWIIQRIQPLYALSTSTIAQSKMHDNRRDELIFSGCDPRFTTQYEVFRLSKCSGTPLVAGRQASAVLPRLRKPALPRKVEGGASARTLLRRA